MPPGRILRHRRLDLGLSQDAVAADAHLSKSQLQKIESGERSATPHVLRALTPVLRLSEPDRNLVLRLTSADPVCFGSGRSGPRLTIAQERRLDFNPFPACYMMPPMTIGGILHEIVAVNDAFRTFFPELEPGVSTLAYELLNAKAKDVFVHWEANAHNLVRAFRAQVDGYFEEQRISELKQRFGGSRDFLGMWDTDYPAVEPADIIWVCDTADGTVFEMFFYASMDGVGEDQVLHWGLTPLDSDRYFKRYPERRTHPASGSGRFARTRS
ncbi:helix-turn-helix domain-containing protein [Nocardia terrae]|nr:helix-turn-helix domain-containing protein [Nocardia terrae]